MPCYTMQTMEVQFGANTSASALMLALKGLHLGPRLNNDVIYFGSDEWINVNTGAAQISAVRDVRTIKRAYSAELVKQQAKKYGWQLKETAPYEFQVTKR